MVYYSAKAWIFIFTFKQLFKALTEQFYIFSFKLAAEGQHERINLVNQFSAPTIAFLAFWLAKKTSIMSQ